MALYVAATCVSHREPGILSGMSWLLGDRGGGGVAVSREGKEAQGVKVSIQMGPVALRRQQRKSFPRQVSTLDPRAIERDF